MRSSPAVVDGMVFVGSNDHNVYALNQSTGAKIWNYSTGARVISSPAVVNGVVFVGVDNSHFGSVGGVFALNQTTGNQIWNFTINRIWTYSDVS